MRRTTARPGTDRKHSARNERKAKIGTVSALLAGYRAPKGVLYSVATDLYESLATPISLSCEILLRYAEFEQLARKSISPHDYNCPFQFRDDYQAVSFLKKAPLRIEGVDPEAAAREKFLAAEAECARTNSRIRQFVRAPEGVSTAIRSVISTAMAKIASCLGPSPNAREWLYSCRFGPGVFNHTRSNGLTSIYDKLQVQPSVSHDMADVAALLVMSQPQWARSITDSEVDGFWPILNHRDFDLVPGNRVAFVPKTAVTHRAIAIEPLMNIYAQLGLGAVMRRKLLRVGIDLNDQRPNQVAAYEGSLTGHLSTIDLSSASDTVAKELVRLLLPPGWFFPLDLIRSKSGEMDGKWFRYEKFSSMGNGCTFELETLIFWALMSSVCSELKIQDEVLVYGDDIVIPVPAYDLAKEVLEWCGFSLNPAKSFRSGPFRESCGKDYYMGVDVRPFFQKEIPCESETLFRLANGLRRLSNRRNGALGGCDERLRKVWQNVVRALPRPVSDNLRVPAHAGDSDGLICNWDESQRSFFVTLNKRGWEGYSGARYQASPVIGAKPGNWLGVVASQLYRLSDGGKLDSQLLGVPREGWIQWLAENKNSPSGSPNQKRGVSYRLRVDCHYGVWTDFGPWI